MESAEEVPAGPIVKLIRARQRLNVAGDFDEWYVYVSSASISSFRQANSLKGISIVFLC